jgi:hypothetical protein
VGIIRVGFCKYNITIEKYILEKVEKDFCSMYV